MPSGGIFIMEGNYPLSKKNSDTHLFFFTK